jgi:hypothetical protein
MSRSRQLTASFGIDQQKLVVTTPYGTAQPPAGTNLFSCGTNVVCSILDSPVLNGTTQYVCTGWTGSGSVPLSGSATNTGVFALTEDSAVAWQWKTQYWFAAGSEPGGSVTAVNGWYDPEGTATASVSVSSGFCFVNWVGDVPPEAATNPSVVLAMNQPRAITAHVSVDTNLIHASQASDGYRSPETNRVVSCQFHYPADRNMISLLWTVDLPGGWGVAAASGNGSPQVVGNEILFAGVLTNNPIEFTYTLTIPGNAATTNELGGSVEFQFEGMANAVGIAALPDPLLLQRYHSADYRASYWVMDAAEANRVLAYWRAGGYQVNPLGYDGYASGAGSTNGGYHSADYRTNRWVIDGTEANRVLAYMRANGYHVDPAGNDGYVAGPAGGFRAESSGDKLMIPVQATQAGPGGYDPEGGVEISNVFTYSSALLSLLWRPQLPKGWELLSVSGDGSPELQHGEILWTGSLPPSPIRMAYTAHVPLWELRATGITAEVEYQVSGMPNAATLSPDPVLLELSARDADNDGLPDGWEAHYTGGATNMTPGADDDYDGANNLQELIAGTNPTNDASVLAIEQVTAPAVYGSVISWPSVSNRFYEVDRATNLVSPGFEPIAVGIPAFPPVNVYTDAVEGIEGAFYRITVENQ